MAVDPLSGGVRTVFHGLDYDVAFVPMDRPGALLPGGGPPTAPGP